MESIGGAPNRCASTINGERSVGVAGAPNNADRAYIQVRPN
jgi:hypothetical protein